MEFRPLQITLISANDLPDVRNLGLMKVYAKVSINGEKKTIKKTPPDVENQTNPVWNFPVEYTISESAVEKPGMSLGIRLYCKRTFGDRFIGVAKISIKTLFDDRGIGREKFLSCPVSGTPNGKLNISYIFGEKFLGRKPSGSIWKKGMIGIGFLVLLGGAMLLLDDDEDKSDQEEDDDDDDGVKYRTPDGEVFYNAQS